MSAFDALGTAAAILQIVELGIKLGIKATQVYNSKGRSDERSVRAWKDDGIVRNQEGGLSEPVSVNHSSHVCR